MGIDQFYQNLNRIAGQKIAQEVSLKRDAATTTTTKSYDHIYFDLNHMIHRYTKLMGDNESKFFGVLRHNIILIMRKFKVKKSVFFAVDGPAPRAKLLVQRMRRVKQMKTQCQDSNTDGDGDDHAGDDYPNESDINVDNDDNNFFDTVKNINPDAVEVMYGSQDALSELDHEGDTLIIDSKKNNDMTDDFDGDENGNISNVDKSVHNDSERNRTLHNPEDKENYKSKETEKQNSSNKAMRSKERSSMSLQFTPGTLFMNRLKSFLENLSRSILNQSSSSSSSSSSPVHVYVSPSSRFGEGEFKIFEHIRYATDIVHDHDTALVVGGDSDLIVFSLHARIEVDMLRPDTLELFSSKKIKKSFQSLFPSWCNINRIIDDFTFLVVMSGNDYTPKLKGYLFPNTWNFYIQTMKATPISNSSDHNHLVRVSEDSDDVEINLKLFLQIAQASKVSNVTSTSFLNQICSQHNIPFPNYEVDVQKENTDDPSIHYVKVTIGDSLIAHGNGPNKKLAFQDASHKILISKKARSKLFQMGSRLKFEVFTELMNQYLIHFPRSTPNEKIVITSIPERAEKIEDEIESYFRCIAWVLKYFKGRSVDNSLYFKYVAPKVTDLIEQTDSLGDSLKFLIPEIQQNPLFPLEFCIAVLPSFAQHVVPLSEVTKAVFQHVASKEKILYSDQLQAWLKEDAIERIQLAVQSKLQELQSHKEATNDMTFTPTIRFRLEKPSEKNNAAKNLWKKKKKIIMEKEVLGNGFKSGHHRKYTIHCMSSHNETVSHVEKVKSFDKRHPLKFPTNRKYSIASVFQWSKRVLWR